MTIHWSHLTLAAYEYFLLCEECGVMVHDSPYSQTKHEEWHTKIEEQVLYPLREVRLAAEDDLDLDHALYVLGRWTIVQSRQPGWDNTEEDHRNRVLLNKVLAALGLKSRIARDAP